jgi:four helix bundle protein
MKVTGCSLADAIQMASTNPAKLYNLNDRGTMEAGKRADLVLFSMEDFEVQIQKTFVKGELVYELGAKSIKIKRQKTNKSRNHNDLKFKKKQNFEIMNENQYKPIYDLEERTFQFAKKVRLWVKKIPKTVENIEDIKQIIKASGSVGANYIEANESLSKKDFAMRIRISRKEAKESAYWIRLILETNDNLPDIETGKYLFQEATELKKILSSIELKSK